MAIELLHPEVLPTGQTLDRTAAEAADGFFMAGSPRPSQLARVGFFERGAPAPATPSEVLLGTVNHPLLRLRIPVPLEVRRESDYVGVWSDELEQLGTGIHLTAALIDIQRTLVEAFLVLESEADHLSPAMQKTWRALSAYIERRG